MELIKNLKKKHDEIVPKIAGVMTSFIRNGGWITICTIGAVGVLYALIGMHITLLDIYYTSGTFAFISCVIILLVVLFASGLGIKGIVNIIRKNKDLFK